MGAPYGVLGLLTLCVLCVWLCECRPAGEKLPHSKDFYAGYIKALNDNFEALFKPEDRETRSVEDKDAEEVEREVSQSFWMLSDGGVNPTL